MKQPTSASLDAGTAPRSIARTSRTTANHRAHDPAGRHALAFRVATGDGTPLPREFEADTFTMIRVHCALTVQLQDDIVRQAARETLARFDAWMASCPM